MLLILIHATISLYISYVWIHYLRMLDIFKKESIIPVLAAFLLEIIILLADQFFDIFGFIHNIPWGMNGDFTNDFFYCVLKIGLFEELLKLLPFFLLFFYLRKYLKEPIDYVILMVASALGFSAVENFSYFYSSEGFHSITGRAIISTPGHICLTAICSYGIILHVFKNGSKKWLSIPVSILIAAFAHGFFDFWLIWEKAKIYGWLISSLSFLVLISIATVIINNALNNSRFFSYKNLPDNGKIFNYLFIHYSIIYLLYCLILFWQLHDTQRALLFIISGLYYMLGIMLITLIRMSRFKLVQHRWEPIKPELPFYLQPVDDLQYYAADQYSSRVRIVIKGDAYNEVYLSKFYNEYCLINSVSSQTGEIGAEVVMYIQEKLFFKNFESYYLIKIFDINSPGLFVYYMIKPKKFGLNLIASKYPIVSLLSFVNPYTEGDEITSDTELSFEEWCYIKPLNQKTEVNEFQAPENETPALE